MGITVADYIPVYVLCDSEELRPCGEVLVVEAHVVVLCQRIQVRERGAEQVRGVEGAEGRHDGV